MQRIHQSSRSSVKGFTLIELLVVIAIIAILASILFPVFAQAREKARQTTCLSNEKQMGIAIIMYKQDYDETFPFFQYTDGNGYTVDWNAEIFPYVKNGDSQHIGTSTYVYGTNGIWSCPSFPSVQVAEYGPNYLLFPGGNGTYQYTSSSTAGTFLLANDSQIDSPSDKIMVVEKGQGVLNASANFVTPLFDPSEGNFTNSLAPIVNGVPSGVDTHNELQYDFDCALTSTASNCATWGTSPGDMPRFRHNGTTNSLFVDGHVKSIVRGQMNWYKNIYITGLYEKFVNYSGTPGSEL